MKIALVCNCGLLIEAGGAALLIDAPNGKLPPFGRRSRRMTILRASALRTVTPITMTRRR